MLLCPGEKRRNNGERHQAKQQRAFCCAPGGHFLIIWLVDFTEELMEAAWLPAATGGLRFRSRPDKMLT